jgi:hypothetical protein
MYGLFLQPTKFGILIHQLLQPPMDVDMTYLLQSKKLHITSTVFPFAPGSLHPGLDSKPLNGGCELQNPIPLLTYLLKHILTPHGLSRCQFQFLCVYHPCSMRAMASLQIPRAITLQIVFIEYLSIYFLLCLIHYKFPMQIPMGNPNGNMPLCTYIQPHTQPLLAMLLHDFLGGFVWASTPCFNALSSNPALLIHVLRPHYPLSYHLSLPLP